MGVCRRVLCTDGGCAVFAGRAFSARISDARCVCLPRADCAELQGAAVCAVAYLPKATVQAAIGGIALSQGLS